MDQPSTSYGSDQEADADAEEDADDEVSESASTGSHEDGGGEHRGKVPALDVVSG